MYDFAKIFSNCYVIDLRQYAPKYGKKFREKYYLGSHMNPVGYVLTACMVETYIDYNIKKNINDFKQVGFIGTKYKYVEQHEFDKATVSVKEYFANMAKLTKHLWKMMNLKRLKTEAQYA